MKISSLLPVIAILLNSCASILNSDVQKVFIDHDPALRVKIDTSNYYFKPRELYNVYVPKDFKSNSFNFLRCNLSIPLIINNSDTVLIKPHRSYFSYWFANLYFTSGIGMIFDYPNDKSFEYPRFNYIENVNNKISNIRFKPITENKFKFSVNIPSINIFYLQTDSGRINSASGMGISAELEYFLKSNYYLSLSIGATMDLFEPFRDSVYFRPRYYDYYPYGFYEYSSSGYVNFRINRVTPWFEYGIGLTLSSLKWSSNNVIESTDSTLVFNQSYYRSCNLGLSCSLALRMTPHFNIGILYQPSFYDFKNKEYYYQHFITGQMIWRF